VQYRLITAAHFSGPGRVIGRLCVSITFEKMTFDLDILRVAHFWSYLDQVRWSNVMD